MSSHRVRCDSSGVENEVMTLLSTVTDDDLVMASDDADHPVGVLQQRYGFTRKRAEETWHAFATQRCIERMNAELSTEPGSDPSNGALESSQRR